MNAQHTAASYKLLVPTPHQQLPRRRTLAAMDAALARAPVLWLLGLPGAGKTSAAAQWVHAAADRGAPCRWYRLDADDADVAGLLAALRQQAPDAALLPAWSPDNQPEPRRFAQRFFSQLAESASADSAPLTLVLDDCHRVPADSLLWEMLDAAREVAAGGRLRFVLISRTPPPAPLARGTVAGWLQVVDDLGLSADEAAALARHVSPHAWSRSELQALEAADGWMAHVLALVQALGRPGGAAAAAATAATTTAPTSAATAAATSAGTAAATSAATAGVASALEPAAATPSITSKAADTAGSVGDFLCHELLLMLPAPERRGFRLLAELPEVPRTLACVTPAAAQLLDQHAARRYFVDSTTQDAWRLHDLLRDGLRAHNQRSDSATELAAARRALAQAVLAHQPPAPETAMHLLVAAADSAGALALLRTHGRGWLAQGRHGQVLAWLAALPAGQIDTDAHALLWRAEALLPGTPEDARPLFARSRQWLLARQAQAGDTLSADAGRAGLSADAGRTERPAHTDGVERPADTGRAALPADPDRVERPTDANRAAPPSAAERAELLADTYRAWCGEVASYVVQWGAVQGLAELVDELEHIEQQLGPAPGDWRFRTAADALTALMYGRAEDPRIQHHARATALAVQQAPDAASRITAAAQLLIYRLWWAGDFPGGRALYDSFDAEVEHDATLPPLARLMWWSNAAIVDWQCGDPARCFDKVERGLALADNSGVHVRDFFLLTQGIFCALSQEDFARAETYLARLALAERSLSYKHRRLDTMVHQFFRSWYALSRGDAATALAHAQTAWPMAEAMGSLFHKVIVLSALAPAALHAGDLATAKQAYRAQLALAKGSQNPTFAYIAFCAGAEIALVTRDLPNLRKQVERMLTIKQLGGFHSDCGWRTPIRARLLAFALDQGVLPGVARQWILEKRVPPPAGFAGAWPMPVQITALGGLVVHVSGITGQQSDAGSKAGNRLRELLAVLVARRHGATQAELCDWLWPDADGDKAAASLKVGVHRLRSWLGHDAVLVRNGMVALNLLRVACDLWWHEDHEPRALAQAAPYVLAGCHAPPVEQLRERLAAHLQPRG